MKKNKNKILTVSYGTFSCTLEGFDDPFETMKAITECFRDLAAEDRHFGTEPPQADAGMLAQIVEDDATRPVGAHAHEGHYVLKARQDAVSASVGADDTRTTAVEVEGTPSADNGHASTALILPAPGDLSTKIYGPDAVVDAEAFFADSPAPTNIKTEVDAEAETPADFNAPEPPASVEPKDAAPEAAAESIAVKLQRIRDVVSHQPDEAYDEDILPEAGEERDEARGAFFDETEQAGRLGKGPTTGSAAQEKAQDAADAFKADDSIVADTARQDDLEDDDLTAVLDRLEADHAQDRTKQNDNLFTTDEEDTLSDERDEILFGHPVGAKASNPLDDQNDALQTDRLTDPARGRVLKVDRADLEAALAAGDLEELGKNVSKSAPDDPAGAQQEHEALAASAERQETERPVARDSLPAIGRGEAEDVSRLMAEADHQMEEPEGATRRSAFAHLRAAVAARFADKSMRKEPSEQESTKTYRSDLEQAVKPRRPVAKDVRRERSAGRHSTPLRLVAEQRVDTETGPITPRRVATSRDEDLDFAKAIGFARFAEDMGAAKLTDVLEAAAAYLTFVEGRDQFTRPQLISLARRAECAEFNREDGLRSFGQLLRAGKIERVEGGHFAVSDSIGYKPDAARAISQSV